jgi:hypothetical protein
MRNDGNLEKEARCDELANEYYAKFDGFICLPFGIGMLGTWTVDTYIREYEIALKTGIPLEPGTDRWRELFGDPVEVPSDVAI